MRIVFSGGGTGGHIYPAIAIADKLKEKVPGVEILFVGARDKLEMEKVPKAGYKIKGLWISGLHRGEIFRNLGFPFKLAHSLWRARQILKSFRPDVVVGVGGFASGSILEMATRMGIPSLIQEQNSFPGITNRLLAKKVDRICVAYENMDQYFPADKIKLTGNPVRSEIMEFLASGAKDYEEFHLKPGQKTILLLGGSLGARSLNAATENSFEIMEKRQDVQLLWQAGKLYYEEYKNLRTAQLPNVKIYPYLEKMNVAYALSDIVISRAGALTISELCVVGKPSILVPSPNVAEDHQTKNALALSSKGAALLIPDQDAKDSLLPEALNLLEDLEKRNKMSREIKKMAIRNADEIIAGEITRLASKQ